MTKRYVATRSLHYVATDGTERLVAEGETVEDISDAKADELAAGGFIRDDDAEED